LEISESVCLALQDFHFGMEAFGDSVVAGEAPHAGDLLAPCMERFAELQQWREPATTERRDFAEQALRQLPAFVLVMMLFQQQIAEPLLEAIDRFHGGFFAEVSREALPLDRDANFYFRTRCSSPEHTRSRFARVSVNIVQIAFLIGIIEIDCRIRNSGTHVRRKQPREAVLFFGELLRPPPELIPLAL